MKKIDPMIISVDDKTYTLEFSRKSVAEAEREGFAMTDDTANVMNLVPELFYYAFKMHHPEVTHELTDDILFNVLEGLTDDEIAKLAELYQVPYTTLIRSEARKNPRVTVRI